MAGIHLKKRKPGGERYARAVGWHSTEIFAWLRRWLAARGVDPEKIPEPAYHIVRMPELRELTGLSTPTLYRLMNDPAAGFPASIALDLDVSHVVPMRRLVAS